MVKYLSLDHICGQTDTAIQAPSRAAISTGLKTWQLSSLLCIVFSSIQMQKLSEMTLICIHDSQTHHLTFSTPDLTLGGCRGAAVRWCGWQSSWRGGRREPCPWRPSPLLPFPPCWAWRLSLHGPQHSERSELPGARLSGYTAAMPLRGH